MARELRWWIGAALAACGIVVLAYVPPRGVPEEQRHRDRDRDASAVRVRAQELAAQWREADLDLRLAEYRARLEPELARRRSTDQPGAALLVDGPDSSAKAIEPILRTALDTVWSRLGLGVTKVSVAVAVSWEPGNAAHRADTPKPDRYSGAYMLPNATDRATCVALLPAWRRQLLESKVPARFEAWLEQGLGPCALYAAFGVPSKPVRYWLAHQEYDLALYSGWDREGPGSEGSWFLDSGTQRWRWQELYFDFPAHFSPATLACLGGRAEGCRDAVLEGASYSLDDSLSPFVNADFRWRRKRRLLDGGRFLADLARDIGHDRFLRFWSSPLPVDTALAAAMQMPVGKWTERWERRFVPTLPFGAAAPLGASGLGVLLAVAALTSVAVGARRRQVR